MKQFLSTVAVVILMVVATNACVQDIVRQGAPTTDGVIGKGGCPQGEERTGHLAYKLCIWQDIGVARNLIWCDTRTGCWTESRGGIRKLLYSSGVLNVGKLKIKVGLRGLKPNTKMVLYATMESGKIGTVTTTSNEKGEVNVDVWTVNGEGTLWVPGHTLTGDHFVKLESEGTPLLYNQKDKAWFTRKGEDVTSNGTPEYPATRLNTKVKLVQ